MNDLNFPQIVGFEILQELSEESYAKVYKAIYHNEADNTQ
jgi:hypothetical protein